MSVKIVLTTVTPMLPAPTLQEVSHVPVMKDTVEMEGPVMVWLTIL